MKKTKKLSAVIILVGALAIALISCGSTPAGAGKITVVISDGEAATEYEVSLDKISRNEGLISVLDYLREYENLSYKEKGGMLIECGDLKEDAAAGKYLYIWSDIEENFDVSDWASTLEYKGKSLTSNGIGAKDMKIKDGAVIYISYIVYE